jgi:hypothetical protein
MLFRKKIKEIPIKVRVKEIKEYVYKDTTDYRKKLSGGYLHYPNWEKTSDPFDPKLKMQKIVYVVWESEDGLTFEISESSLLWDDEKCLKLSLKNGYDSALKEEKKLVMRKKYVENKDWIIINSD